MRTKTEQIIQKLGEMTILQIEAAAEEILATPAGDFLWKAMCEVKHGPPQTRVYTEIQE